MGRASDPYKQAHMKTNVAVAKTVVAPAAVVATLLLMLPPFAGGGAALAATAATATGLGSNCTRRCGNISIPYPFGIELGCYHDTGFNLTCKQKHSHRQPPNKLFLGDGTVQVLDISVEHSTVRIYSPGVQLQYDGISTGWTWGLGLPETGPYFLSESASMLEAMGCSIQVSVRGGLNVSLVSSCTAICPVILSDDGGARFTVGNGSCTGIGCCQASIVVGYPSYRIQIDPVSSGTLSNIPASVFIVDQSYFFNSIGEQITGSLTTATLDWIISTSTCPTNMTAPECLSDHSYCQDSSSLGHGGYTCQCADGYQGNPYVQGGCQDIDECKYPDQYVCYGVCKNTPGSFICQCNTGYTGNASIPNACTDIDECKHQEAYSCYGICQNFPGSFHCQCPEGSSGNYSTKGGCITFNNSFTGLSIGLGVGGGTILLLLAIGAPYIMRKIKLQKVKKMKQRFFKQNHGLLLQQLISRSTDIGERMIITLRDIEKATNNFDRARIIGGGGHGVVFKGILDLHVVAIKKSKIVVQREINEFINEVVVLSQVNHRNVVKLLGCCLETEVPLLVYEFISNGTLCHHLHVEGPVSLPWHDRMRIAAEVAKAISYLHASASMPIFHRDIKSSNVLLDDALTAKVSDFGASRYIPIDQTGVTTAVQGTMGYLDPMYYYNGRLTDKSDVFSFGVLLVELLTRKRPYVYRSVDDDGLVSHFVSLLVEGKLVDIIDHQVMEEEGGEIEEVATLAAMCTKLKGEDRPTMREVEMALECLLVKKRQVQYNGTRQTNSGEIAGPYMSTDRGTKEASRQYTMEEEMLLSASFPR
ncbi:unnamed protein product [Miscanthus lutarioriparius]|uniref:Protein kinase domain-containing protein n=1 Tax=Miscanthus lutarioriparius TaxID=422564 RepID=A0A811R3G3_9POAL|nr:unnamed protein product [Miscanthus lutarioriparius]